MRSRYRLLQIEKRSAPLRPVAPVDEDSREAWLAFRRQQARLMATSAQLLRADRAPRETVNRFISWERGWWRQAGIDDPATDPDAFSEAADLRLLERLKDSTGWTPEPLGDDVLNPRRVSLALADDDVFEQRPLRKDDPYLSAAKIIAWYAQRRGTVGQFVRQFADLKLLRFTHLGSRECDCTWCVLDHSESFTAELRREYLRRLRLKR